MAPTAETAPTSATARASSAARRLPTALPVQVVRSAWTVRGIAMASRHEARTNGAERRRDHPATAACRELVPRAEQALRAELAEAHPVRVAPVMARIGLPPSVPVLAKREETQQDRGSARPPVQVASDSPTARPQASPADAPPRRRPATEIVRAVETARAAVPTRFRGRMIRSTASVEAVSRHAPRPAAPAGTQAAMALNVRAPVTSLPLPVRLEAPAPIVVLAQTGVSPVSQRAPERLAPLAGPMISSRFAASVLRTRSVSMRSGSRHSVRSRRGRRTTSARWARSWHLAGGSSAKIGSSRPRRWLEATRRSSPSGCAPARCALLSNATILVTRTTDLRSGCRR